MSNFEAENFYKVYLTSRSFQSMLIPPTAVVCSNELMPATATLRNCNGKCWHVEVIKCDGKMYFKKGWRRFIDENSVNNKDFLVFSYVGCSVFDVKVFEALDGLEKSVSHVVSEGKIGEEHGQEEEDDDDEFQKEGEDSVLELEEEEKDDDDYQEEGDDSELELVEEEENEEVLDSLNKRRGQKTPNKRNRGWHEEFAATNDEGTTSMEVEDEELYPEKYVQHLNPYFVVKIRPLRKNELDSDRQNPTQFITEMCGFVTILSVTFLLHKTKDMVDGASSTTSLSIRSLKHEEDGFAQGIPLKWQDSLRIP